jgi:hypothetical protein
MKKFISWVWSMKQTITATITGSVSGAAVAHWITAEMAVNITTATGILMTVFALVHTYFVPDPPAPPAGAP